MKQLIPAGKFKAQCLKIMDMVNESKQSVIITKRNQPVVEINPIKKKQKTKIFGCMKDLVISETDLISPIGDDWNAAS